MSRDRELIHATALVARPIRQLISYSLQALSQTII